MNNEKQKIIETVKNELLKEFPGVKFKIETLNDEYDTVYFIIDKITYESAKFKDWRYKIKRDIIWKNEDINIGFDYDELTEDVTAWKYLLQNCTKEINFNAPLILKEFSNYLIFQKNFKENIINTDNLVNMKKININEDKLYMAA